MSILFARMKKPILVWMAIVTAILVAIHQILGILGFGGMWGAIPRIGWLSEERMTDVLVFWALCLLLGAAHLWNEAMAGRGKWKDMERALADLETSYAKLKELEGWRDDLSHFVVHDIKHAVAGIDGSLQLLKRQLGPSIPPETGQFLTCAREFTEDLLVLVSTLLDVARLESAGMPLRKSVCDAGILVRESVKRAQSLSTLNRLRIEMETQPVSLVCDKELVERVVVNLLSNAVRFAPSDSVVLVKADVDGGFVRIAVTDRGPGVPPEFQAKVFEKFLQGGSRALGGVAGLGLTFCRLAVEAHGGKIGVESPVDASDGDHPGSRFWFTLPLMKGD